MAGAQTGGAQQLEAGTAGALGVPQSPRSREASQKLEGERDRGCPPFRTLAQKSHSMPSAPNS